MTLDFAQKGYIFDFDGTLADSMWVWEWVDAEFARRRNLELNKDHAETIAALGFEATADFLIEHFGLDESPEDLMLEWQHMAAGEYAENVELKPGALEYVRKLKEQGRSVAIATSLQRLMLEPCLKHNGLYDLMDAIVVCEEVCVGGKSTPAVYEVAADKLGVPLGECVVFEDISKAARSAKAGGAYVVGIKDDHQQQNFEALAEVADEIIESFEDLL